jgi:transposase
MKRSKTYRAKSVKQVECEEVVQGRGRQAVQVGLDIGKRSVLAVVRWKDGTFERPWLVKNPEELGAFVGLLRAIRRGRPLRVAMEPTGTYGDALRQALFDADIRVERVSPKVAHDYAEVFDGVPSQFDGKDAGVVAELSALGKSQEWTYEEPSQVDQELGYWVDWMDAQRRQAVMWQGRLEALLARHWPEATRCIKVSSVTLMSILEQYGGPQALAQDPQATARVARWGGHYLSAEKIRRLLASARETVGVRQGVVDLQRMRQYAGQALAARREVRRGKCRLAKLAQANAVIQAQAPVVGLATACVLWVYVGDPREYFCAAAYRKAMGLNLTEYSSGDYQGRLRISKRGASAVRRWLYLAALRWIRSGPTKRWYLRKRARDGEATAKRAVMGVMRKLAKGLHWVGTTGESFQPERLFARQSSPGGKPARRSPVRSNG